jgi:hypothetical protein
VAERTVVLLCGPPGAGKSTLARELAAERGLELFDLDEPQWAGSEKKFRQALREVGGNPAAQAVVIRSGATKSARAKAADLVGATEVKVLDTDRKTCERRVVDRDRQSPPVRTQLAAVGNWWKRYEAGPVFLGPAPTDPARSQVFLSPNRSNGGGGGGQRAKTSARGYGTAHQKLRKELSPKVEAGGVRCWRCGELIQPGEGWHLGHDDDDRRIHRGPEHSDCNLRAAGLKTAGRLTRPRWNSREW